MIETLCQYECQVLGLILKNILAFSLDIFVDGRGMNDGDSFIEHFKKGDLGLHLRKYPLLSQKRPIAT